MTETRAPLSRDLILTTAVGHADEHGLEATSMRRLADALGVTPMALYKHVTSREELIDGMVDTVIAEIAPMEDRSADPAGWTGRLRAQVLAARDVLARRAWATEAIETRQASSPIVLAYMDTLMGIMRSGGLSMDLVHHAMHALSSRMWGLTRDVFPTPALPEEPTERQAVVDQVAIDYPNIAEMVNTVSASGSGCDADVEFEFALDMLLDGIDRLHRAGWTPPIPRSHHRTDHQPDP